MILFCVEFLIEAGMYVKSFIGYHAALDTYLNTYRRPNEYSRPTTSVVKATPWRTSLNAADVFSLSSFYITVVVVVVAAAAAAATAFVIWEQRTTQNLCKVIKGWTKDSAFTYCCGSSVSIIFSINCNHTNISSSVKQQQQRTSNTNTQPHSYTVACKPFKRKQEMTIKYQFCK